MDRRKEEMKKVEQVISKHGGTIVEMSPCTYCGEDIRLSFGDELNAKLIDQQSCFSCDFWLRYMSEYFITRPEASLVINGIAYTVGDEDSKQPTKWRGFGGRLFIWKWTDKEMNDIEQSSTNMWHRGDVPKHFQKLLPDNGEWIHHVTGE